MVESLVQGEVWAHPYHKQNSCAQRKSWPLYIPTRDTRHLLTTTPMENKETCKRCNNYKETCFCCHACGAHRKRMCSCEKDSRIELYYIETAINRFKDYFVKKHFSEDGERYENNWVGWDVGGLLDVSDMFFSLDAMLEYERHWYTTEQIIDHYYYSCDELAEWRSAINIKNWKSLVGNTDEHTRL